MDTRLCILALTFVNISAQSYKDQDIGSLDMVVEASREETIETTKNWSGYYAANYEDTAQGVPEKAIGGRDTGNTYKIDNEKSQHGCGGWAPQPHLTPPCSDFACSGLKDS